MEYKPQHFEAPDGTPLVVITADEYKRLLATVDDDAADIAAADRARADDTRFPAEVVDAIIDGATPVAAWRQYRGLSQAALAGTAGMTQAGVSRLETKKDGRAPAVGRLETRRALAKALDVPLSALDPLED